ncbi:MAG: CvpA family protein [Candidatus Omnitrophota bacterium]
MEWFWTLVDRFQKGIAGSALHSFALTDWVFLFLILVGLAWGGRKGFSDMFGKLLGIFLVSMLTLSFYQKVAKKFLSFFPIRFAEAAAFFLLAVFLWISIAWCLNIFGKFFKIEAQGFLKTLGGVIFGVLRMVLLVSFVVQFLLFLPFEPVQKIFKRGRTYAGYAISRIVPDLHVLVMTPFRKPTSRKSAASVQPGG